MSNENLTEKTLADVQAGIPARDAEIETLRKENAELREQLEAIGAGGIKGKLMPGAVSAKPASISLEVCTLGNYGAAYDLPGKRRAYTYEHQPGNIKTSRLGSACLEAAAASAGDTIDRGLGLLKELQAQGFGVFDVDASRWHAAPVATQAQIEDDSIALDRLADYISDTWPMDKKYGIEEICQRLHAMWPGEFMPASQVDKSTETQGKSVDESPNLQGQQKPASGADGLPTERVLIDGTAYELPAAVAAELLRLHLEILGAEQAQSSGNSVQLDHLPDATKMVPGDQFRDAAQMIEPSGNSGELPVSVRDALDWYAQQVGNCRRFGTAGDAARADLDADGGRRARAALAQQDAARKEPDQ